MIKIGKKRKKNREKFRNRSKMNKECEKKYRALNPLLSKLLDVKLFITINIKYQ